jgi:hypothetical protein
MKKINWKTAGLGMVSFALMILTKIVDDKTRNTELEETVSKKVAEALSNQLKES